MTSRRSRASALMILVVAATLVVFPQTPTYGQAYYALTIVRGPAHPTIARAVQVLPGQPASFRAIVRLRVVGQDGRVTFPEVTQSVLIYWVVFRGDATTQKWNPVGPPGRLSGQGPNFQYVPPTDGVYLVHVEVRTPHTATEVERTVQSESVHVYAQTQAVAPSPVSVYEDLGKWWWGLKMTWSDGTKATLNPTARQQAAAFEAKTFCARLDVAARRADGVIYAHLLTIYFPFGNPASSSYFIKAPGTWTGRTFNTSWWFTRPGEQNRGRAMLGLRTGGGRLWGWWRSHNQLQSGSWEFLRTATPITQACPL